mgnify:CR=1 FL=1
MKFLNVLTNFIGSISTLGDVTLSGQASPTIALASNDASTGRTWTLISRYDGKFDLSNSGVSAVLFDTSSQATFSANLTAPSLITSTDSGISINGITMTRVAANTAIRVSDGLETLGLLRSYAGLNIAQTATFGGNATFNGTQTTFNPDANSQAKILNVGTDAIALYASSGDGLYLGGGGTTNLYLDASTNADFSGNVTVKGAIQVGPNHLTSSPGDGVIFAPYGTGTNIAGGELQFFGGRSTGTGAGGNMEFYTSPTGTAGTGINSAIIALTLDSSQNATFTGDVRASTGKVQLASQTTTALEMVTNQLTLKAGGLQVFTGFNASQDGVIIGNSTGDIDIKLAGGSGTKFAFLEGQSGNVGIGTASPAEKLQVNGNIFAEQNIIDGDVNNANPNLLTQADIKIAGQNDIYNNTAKVVISPYEATYTQDGTTTNGGATIRLDAESTMTPGDTFTFSVYYKDLVGTIGIDIVDVGVTGSHQQANGTAGAPKSGRIYGTAVKPTTSPQNGYNFVDINTSISCTVTLLNPKLETGKYPTEFVATTDEESVPQTITTNDIIATGNVGIGTTTIGTNDKLLIKTSVDNSVAQGLVIQRSANTDEGYINYNGGGFQFRSTDGDPIVFGTVSNEYVRINPSGFLGINTTNTLVPLVVEGQSLNPSIPTAAASTAIVRVESGNGGVSLDIGSQGSSPYSMWMQVGNTSNNSGDVYPILLNPLGGNVGIGTTAPGNKLVVRGPSSDASGGDGNVAQFEGPSGTNGFQVYVNDTLNNTGIQTKNGDSFIINPGGGRVGIGTTGPSQNLHVAGNARVTGKFFDSSNSAGAPVNNYSKALTATSSGTAWKEIVFTPDIWEVNNGIFTSATTLVCDTVRAYNGNTNTTAAGAGAGEIRIVDAGVYEIIYSVAIQVGSTSITVRQNPALFLTAHPVNGSEVAIPGSVNSVYLRLPNNNQGGRTSFANTCYYEVPANTDIALNLNWLNGAQSVEIYRAFGIENTISIRKISDFQDS